MSTEEPVYVSADELGSAGATAAEAQEFRLPLDTLLALRPFGYKRVTEGVVKPFDAREVYVISVDEEGNYEDLGMRDCAWTAVMRELDKSTDEAPWIVGTVQKGNRAYFLQPPDADQMKMALVAISQMMDDRRAEESRIEASFGEEPF